MQKYTAAIQTYANEHLDATNTLKHRIIDEVGEFIERSALSEQIGGRAARTIMLILGSDLSIEVIKGCDPWFKGGFHSGTLRSLS